MFIRFKCGSTWQVIGSDNYKSLVGTPPAGIVFSEWAKAHPGHGLISRRSCWRTAAGRCSSPRRRAATTPTRCTSWASTDDKWFAELQTVEDSGSIPLDSVEQQRKEYHALYGDEAGDALIEQEYYCSFSAAILGAFWGKEMARAEREGRLTKLR
jgi:phage terminase large subunit